MTEINFRFIAYSRATGSSLAAGATAQEAADRAAAHCEMPPADFEVLDCGSHRNGWEEWNTRRMLPQARRFYPTAA